MSFGHIFCDMLARRGHNPKAILFTKDDQFANEDEKLLCRAYSEGITDYFAGRTRINECSDLEVAYQLGQSAAEDLLLEVRRNREQREEEYRIIREKREAEARQRELERSKGVY